MMWGYSFNWPSMTLMMLGSTLWIVVLIILGWAVIRWLNKRTPNATWQTHTLAGSGPTAVEILSQRYARGEIDTTTFEQMRERLGVSNNEHQRSWAEVRRPVGESLFDGKTRGSDIL
ncbi:MAG: hypothetical protein NVSMB38_40060 [Ktedonobacteraceae bacterium]